MIPKRINRKIIYENPWVDLYVDKVQFPNGKIIDEHHYIHFEYQSAGIVIQNEHNEILLIKSNRYITQSEEWEIPAGKAEEGENILTAVIRETLEETGYEIETPKLLYRYYPMNGISDKIFVLYKASAAKKVNDFDRTEVIKSQWFSVSEIEDMIKNNKINCGLSLTALMLVIMQNREGE